MPDHRGGIHPLNRPISRRRLLQFGLPVLGLGLADVLRCAGIRRDRCAGHRPREAVADRLLDARRLEPARHVRPEAGRPGRVSRAVSPDRDLGPGRLRHRAVSPSGEGHGPALARPVGPPRQRRSTPPPRTGCRPATSGRPWRGTHPEALVRLRDRPRRRPAIAGYARLCDDPQVGGVRLPGLRVYLGAAYQAVRGRRRPQLGRFPGRQPVAPRGPHARRGAVPLRRCSGSSTPSAATSTPAA